MFVKQIDEKTALELAAKGKEVLILVPAGKDADWEGMMPDTLEHMLDGCMFFRKEPAMEMELMELTVEPAGQTIEPGPEEPENRASSSSWLTLLWVAMAERWRQNLSSACWKRRAVKGLTR